MNSSSLTSRAAGLAAAGKSVLPLAMAASASAASLNFDFFGSAMYDNSGFFISTLTPPAVGGGITQGTGFKLYGSESLDDSAFYRYDSFLEETVARSDGDGLGMLWGGSIDGSLQAGDVISAPFEFDYSFTHTPAFEGDTYVSNPWQIRLGLLDRTGYDPINWSEDAAYGQLWAFHSVQEQGYQSEAGSYSVTGTISLTLEEWMLNGNNPTHWFVELAVLVEHENDYFAFNGPFPKLNGDVLNVTVPQNSIDIAYQAIPEPSSLVIVASGGLLLMRRRRRA
ncbi:MAG: PEP-CTERM sorting domain-containing protein [Verrucomicrobiae bacterium]|nr:PEP-CTERM sorting domain-containing protein [Verrucomicrobiae bacterium]